MRTDYFSEAPKRNDVDILLENLKRLRREERILIGLYFYEQLTISEIRDVLHRPIEEIREELARLLPMLVLPDTDAGPSINATPIEIAG